MAKYDLENYWIQKPHNQYTSGTIYAEGRKQETGSRNPHNLMFSFLVLDFNKEEETLICLKSIRERYKGSYPYEIVLYSNGGNQDYIWNYYKAGLADRVVLNNKNTGTGVATHELYDYARAPYSFYIQNDQYLGVELTDKVLEELVRLLGSYDLIDLSGGAGHDDKYSERASICKTETYKNLSIKGYGGPGPFEKDWIWSEAGASYSFWNNNLTILHNYPILFGNLGYRSVREDSSGKINEIKYLPKPF